MYSVLELYVESGVRATNQTFRVDSNKNEMLITHTIKDFDIINAAFALHPLDLIMSFSQVTLNSQRLCLRHCAKASKKVV